MNRLVRWLGGLALGLAILGAFYAYSHVARGDQPYALAEKKIAGLVLADSRQRVELTHKGDRWMVLTASATQTADADRVRNLLGGLAGVSLNDVISDSKSQWSLFEVTEASGTRVTFLDPAGKPTVDGMFGKPAADYTHIYFRYADKPEVYLASGLYRSEVIPGEPSSWVAVEKSTTSSPAPAH